MFIRTQSYVLEVIQRNLLNLVEAIVINLNLQI